MIEFDLKNKTINLVECDDIKKIHKALESLEYTDEREDPDFRGGREKIGLYLPLGRIYQINDINYAFSFRHGENYIDLVINTETNVLNYVMEPAKGGGNNYVKVPLDTKIYRSSGAIFNIQEAINASRRILTSIIKARELISWLNQVIV